MTGTQDQSTSSANNAAQTLTGIYTVNSTTGLGALSLTSPATLSGAFYSVTSTQFVMITTTSGDTNPVLIFGGNWQ